jgi:hypothetical protein
LTRLFPWKRAPTKDSPQIMARFIPLRIQRHRSYGRKVSWSPQVISAGKFSVAQGSKAHTQQKRIDTRMIQSTGVKEVKQPLSYFIVFR